jgi:hypothetical protein
MLLEAAGSQRAGAIDEEEAMIRSGSIPLIALGMLIAVNGHAAQAQSKSKGPPPPAVGTIVTGLEPKAVDILKAASSRLAAAHSMSFTAVISYENPSTLGPPLLYTVKNEVALERPDKLRVITSADGPPSEFYYDGKSMVAYAPAEKLVATAPAPPTIDATLKAAFDSAAIYFPFSDLIVADPYQDIAPALKTVFYIGQSKVVGGTTTDMLAYVSDSVFAQIWIGAEDKLPRRIRAVYRDDPSRLRHDMELSNWQLDVAVPADTFKASTGDAKQIEFARPDPQIPAGLRAEPPRKGATKSPSTKGQ